MKATCAALCVTLITACAPDRTQWMAQAARNEAQSGTADIGSVEQVKAASAQSAQVLRALAVHAQSFTKVAPAVRNGFIAGASDLADGLAAIGASQNDEEFTRACFAMCTDYRKKAEPLIGQVLISLGSSATKEEYRAYWNTFGSRLISIPDRCTQMEQAMAKASQQEQQAEANHRANVNTALIAASVLFAGAVAVESARIRAQGEVDAASIATRPVVTNCREFGAGMTCVSQ